MEPALPLPLRLDLSYSTPQPLTHDLVSDHIASFLAAYAARTGTSNAASSSDDPAASSSTGGVVAAQLTRLINGLSGKIDYDAFSALLHPSDQTPREVLEADEGEGVEEKTDELLSSQTPLDSSLTESPIEASPSKKEKKQKREKKERKASKTE